MLPSLTLYPPQNASAAWPVHPTHVHISRQLMYPATLEATFEDKWDVYKTETTATNPVQLRAFCVMNDLSVNQFKGRVQSITRTIEGNTPMVTIRALDKLQILNEVFAVWVDAAHVPHYVWSQTTPSLAITQAALAPSHDYADGLHHVWYPVPATTDAWISTVASLSTTLGVDMPDNATAITALKLGPNHCGIPPKGFLCFSNGTSEWVEYNGYSQDPSDGYWYAMNVQREALGTAHQAHLSAGEATIVYHRQSKRIHFDTPFYIEGDNTGGTSAIWEPLKQDYYDVGFEEGCFAFTQLPLTYCSEPGGYANIRATYAVYDEENVTDAISLTKLLTALLTVSVANGGPALTGKFTIAISPDITMTRVVCDEPTYLMDFIKRLLDETGLNKGTAQDAIGIWYDASDDKVHIESIAQVAAASADRHYYNVSRSDETVAIDDVNSGVLVNYEYAPSYNLCGTKRFWHTQVSVGGNPEAYHLDDGAWAAAGATYPSACNATMKASASGSIARNLLIDNDTGTGVGIEWNAKPSEGVHFYAWFPGASETAPDLWWIDEVTIALDVSNATSVAGPTNWFGLKVVYYDSFTGSSGTSAPTAIGGGALVPHNLSANLVQEWTEGTLNYQTYSLSAKGLMVQGRAIGLSFTGFMKDTVTNRYGFKLKEIVVRGSFKNQAKVKLAASYSAGATDVLVAPNSYAKMVDSSVGNIKWDILDIGAATRIVALNLGWLQLLQSLALSQARTYALDTTDLDNFGYPQVAESIDITLDTFVGVVDNVEIDYETDGDLVYRNCEMRLINYNTAVFGAS